MTPAGRAQAAIELIETLDRDGAGPADQVLAGWFRARRYVGAKDRRAIAGAVFAILRQRAGLAWALAAADARAGPRQLVLAWGLLVEGWDKAMLAQAFDGSRYGPAPLGEAEARVAEALARQAWPPKDAPLGVRVGLPEWLAHALPESLGEAGLAALSLDEAPVDLRVNTLKTSRAQAQAALKAIAIASAPTPLSPWGLRLDARAALGPTQPFRDGLVEVQDEGSQLAALLVDARPGLKVVDFCAGAGGKSLALAQAMDNKGRVVALDISKVRLDRAGERLRRAGAHIVQRRVLASHRDPWVRRHKGAWDRVLVDAPCTGTGTLRRNPDRKWTLWPKDVGELKALQGDILASAARLVAPGGRLIYATCSLLPAENEEVVEPFLADRPDFEAARIADVWAEVLPGAPYPGDPAAPYLRLDPAHAGTDGFFIAVLQRRRG